jgi:hypothetical protein
MNLAYKSCIFNHKFNSINFTQNNPQDIKINTDKHNLNNIIKN